MGVRGKSVLVTGGAGFIGSHLVDRLVMEDPARIVVVDNFFLGHESNLSDALGSDVDVRVVRLDASDLAAMQDVVEAHQVEMVFDLAVIPLPTSLTYPAWTVTTNVGIVTTFCELARRGAIESLLHVSSSEAYGTARYVPMDEEHPHDSITPYAASKSAGDRIVESYVRTFDIDARTVRPFNNFGPRQNPGSYAGIIPIVVNRVQGGQPIAIHGDGEQTRDFIFAPNTADMIVRVAESPECRGRILNIATGHETSVNELVRRLLAVMDVPTHEVVHVPSRPGDVRRHCADVSLARSLLHYEPVLLNDDDLLTTVQWYVESGR